MGFEIGCILRVVVTLLSTHDVMLGGTHARWDAASTSGNDVGFYIRMLT